MWKGADSRRFVAAVLEMLSVRKLKVGNADITLLAQSPKVSPYRLEIRRSLAQMLGVTENQVNIKATTTEHLGFIGRNEGLAAQAVVLLEPAPENPDDPGALAPRRAGAARRLGRAARHRRAARDRPKTSKSTKSWDSPRAARGRMRCCACASAARIPSGWRASWRARRACKPFEVGFAGLKDRNAVTTQHFTVPRGKRAAEEFIGLKGEGYEVLSRRARTSASCRAARSRATASRSPCAGCAAIRRRSRSACSASRRAASPNYFGEQRFGREAGNLRAGAAHRATAGAERTRREQRKRSGADAMMPASCCRRRAASSSTPSLRSA